MKIDETELKFISWIDSCVSLDHLHDTNIIRKYQNTHQYSRSVLSAKLSIREKVDAGVAPVMAVDDVIVTMPSDAFNFVTRKTLYQFGYNYYRRKIDQGIVVTQRFDDPFDNWREMLVCPRNEDLRWAIRHSSEAPSEIITYHQIDFSFIILQTSEQREILAECLILSIDQNETAKPADSCRTLTLLGYYRCCQMLPCAEILVRNKSGDTHRKVAARIRVLCEIEFGDRLYQIGGVLNIQGNIKRYISSTSIICKQLSLIESVSKSLRLSGNHKFVDLL